MGWQWGSTLLLLHGSRERKCLVLTVSDISYDVQHSRSEYRIPFLYYTTGKRYFGHLMLTAGPYSHIEDDLQRLNILSVITGCRIRP